MSNHILMEWLLENGGPAIRYRTAMDLLDDLVLAAKYREVLYRTGDLFVSTVLLAGTPQGLLGDWRVYGA